MENIEAAMKRIPPHSTEAEQAVLGAMLMNKDAITVTSEILAGQDFYQTAYGILFDAMTDLLMPCMQKICQKRFWLQKMHSEKREILLYQK